MNAIRPLLAAVAGALLLLGTALADDLPSPGNSSA